MRWCAPSQLLSMALLVAFATLSSVEVHGQLSVGSKWSRGGNRSNAVPVTNIRVSAPFVNRYGTPRVFGGVTVGRGFLPFYVPAYDPYCAYAFPYYFTPGVYSVGVRSVFDQAYPGTWGPLGRRRYLGPRAYEDPYSNDPLTYPPLGQDPYDPPSDFQVPDRDATSYSRRNESPRFDFGPAFARPDSLTTFARGAFESTAKPAHTSVDTTPLAVEFTPTASPQQTVAPLGQIESLRLQTEGDQAMRSGDFELARTYYQAAVQAMPDRKSAWLRMTWVHVFQHNHSQAASALNRALLVDDDRNSAWIDAQTLMGRSAASHLNTAQNQLTTWLSDRPRSADRLLLAAAFGFFAGSEDAATEMLALSQRAGVNQNRYDALVAILNLPDNAEPEAAR